MPALPSTSLNEVCSQTIFSNVNYCQFTDDNYCTDQALIRSTVPTSHGYVALGPHKKRPNPMPTFSKGVFVESFEFVGTADTTNYLVVPEAIKWREEVCGGEQAIMKYNTNLAREGGKVVAKILGTRILDNSTHSLTDCALSNVLLPLTLSASKIPGTNTVRPEYKVQATKWMEEICCADYKTFLPFFFHDNKWWVRLSGQVYLEMADFENFGQVVKEVCDRVGKEEFLEVFN